MVNKIQSAKEQLRLMIDSALCAVGYSGYAPSIEIEKPKDTGNGDFSTNIAMRMAKTVKCSPVLFAQKLVDAMAKDDLILEKVEIAGPGFINFYMSSNWLCSVLEAVCQQKENYGRSNIGEGKRVMVEFVSSNPTGPMHVGNARGGAIGDCLASAFDYAGFDVTREFYVNDAGNQIERFGLSLEARYMQLLGGEDSFPFPEDGYHGEDIRQLMREYIEKFGDKHVGEDSLTRRKALVAFGLDRNIKSTQNTLAEFGISYDVWFSESSLYQNGDVEKAISVLKEKGFTYEKEGAVWLKSSSFGEEKDEVLVRASGIPTYFAADIAYHYNKFVTRGFDTVIDVWGADHHGHTARMKGAMSVLGIEQERLQFVLMQLVRLMRGGEVVRVSKRTGKAITLNDLLEDIGSDAARFFFNMRQPSSHFDFDLDLAVSQTNENPVFYVQYAYARVCSIIRLLEAEGVCMSQFSDVDCSVLDTPLEKELLWKLAYFPQEIVDCVNLLEPSKITRYAIDLASSFHSFYNAHRVKVADEKIMTARLLLVDGVKTVLKNALAVLGVSAPERM